MGRNLLKADSNDTAPGGLYMPGYLVKVAAIPPLSGLTAVHYIPPPAGPTLYKLPVNVADHLQHQVTQSGTGALYKGVL